MVNKSYLRVKLYIALVVAFSAWFTLVLAPSGWLGYSAFATFFVCSLLFVSIRCENCGCLAYRVDKTEHGLPSLFFFNQPPKCPICGVERV